MVFKTIINRKLFKYEHNYDINTTQLGDNMDVNETELIALKATLENALKKMDSIMADKFGDDSQWWNRRCSVLAEVFAKGGIVTSEELVNIASKYEISGSGVGGFFARSKSGGGSMIKLGGNKRALTQKGEQEVIEWLKEDEKRLDKFGIDQSKLFF